MEVILLERIPKLGQLGEVVRVKPGYARNYLLPRGKALRATDENIERFEQRRSDLEGEDQSRREGAEGVAGKLDGLTFLVIRQAGEGGQLYGSVSARDIAETVNAKNFSIERGQVALDSPIKELGLHPARIVLHGDVEITITLNVALSEEEGAAQITRAEAEAKAAAEAEAKDEAEAKFAAKERGEAPPAAAEPAEDAAAEGGEAQDSKPESKTE